MSFLPPIPGFARLTCICSRPLRQLGRTAGGRRGLLTLYLGGGSRTGRFQVEPTTPDGLGGATRGPLSKERAKRVVQGTTPTCARGELNPHALPGTRT